MKKYFFGLMVVGAALAGFWKTWSKKDVTIDVDHGITHLGVIMDGNRRWAKARGLPPWEGHRAGAKSLVKTIDFCLSRKIPYVTVYAFSIENFQRSKQELNFLFEVLAQEMAGEGLESCHQKGVKIKFIGDRAIFPVQVQGIIEQAQQRTEKNALLHLNILFCYGGRQEILSGVKNIVKKIQRGELTEDEITDETFMQCLWMKDCPEPDLVVRSGGDQRLSNFLLYTLAYSELRFIDCYWPDVDEQVLQDVVDDFKASKRNFGK